MCRGERRYGPPSPGAHSHVCGSGRSTDEGHGRDLMMVLLQHLAVEMNGEQFWSGAHSNQMPADLVIGTDCYIWGRGETRGKTGSQHSVIQDSFTRYALSTCYAPGIARFWGRDTPAAAPALGEQASEWGAHLQSQLTAVSGATEGRREPRGGGHQFRNRDC